MESIRNSMDPKAKEKHEEEHEDSKKEEKPEQPIIVSRITSVVALMHTCKRELSPAHLVCPRRHNV
jgi:hypothetical protein